MSLMYAKHPFLRVALSVAVPLVALGVPARLMDKRLETSPWILLGAIFVAMHVTLLFLLVQFKKTFTSLHK